MLNSNCMHFNNMANKKKTEKRAFTLAEVLITLGIIGIVAAMTLPALMMDYKKRATISKLRKAYTVISQAYYSSYNLLGDPSQSVIQSSAREYFDNFWAPYLIVRKYCDTYEDCGYTSNRPFTYTKGGSSDYCITLGDTRVPFITRDGITYIVFTAIRQNGNLNDTRIVIVDINGGKAPNKYGDDVFFFERLTDGSVKPFGYNLSKESIDASCSTSGQGFYCAEKLARSGWKFPSDYPLGR